VILTKDLYLRAPEISDAERCYAWLNDPRVRATLAARYAISLAAEREWLQSASLGRDSSSVHFAICLKSGDRHIGNTGLQEISRDNRSATFGIFIGDPANWGRGFGTQTTYAVCRFGFDEMNLWKIRLKVYPFNDRGIKVYEKLGFVREGVHRQELYRDGKYHDVISMGLLAGELKQP
jgi:RimJ/RimL family protein N-acetyltransferase